MRVGRRGGIITVSVLELLTSVSSGLTRDIVSVVFLGKTFSSLIASYTQEYKWVLANCWGNLTNCGRVTCHGLASRPGGVEILLAASCYRNRLSD